MDFKMKDSKSKGKKSESNTKKHHQYYVQYLGWKESRGLGGREYTEPIVKDLVIRRKREELPKLTIEVTHKDLKIVQHVLIKKGKTEKVKYPTVPTKDVTYATQGLSPDEDVVACIYLGYNATTRCAVHVHVYRCDSASTAEAFVHTLNQIITLPAHVERNRLIEEGLVAQGAVTPRPRGFLTQDDTSTVADTIDDNDLSSESEDESLAWPSQSGPRDLAGGAFRRSLHSSALPPGPTDRPSDFRHFSRGSDVPRRGGEYNGTPEYRHSGSHDSYEDEDEAIEREKAEKYTDIAAELRLRLGSKRDTPILLPPQDYDTVHRKQGNLLGIEQRKCLQGNIVGNERRDGEDSAKGDSEGGSGSSPRERQSGYLGDHEDDIIPIGPHWKKGQQFMPPPGERRSLTPVPRSLTPVPRSLTPVPYAQEPRRAASPGPRDDRRPLSSSREYERDSYPYPEGGKRYTATQLGLAAGRVEPGKRLPRTSDEGYTSMDKEFPAGFSRNPDYFYEQSAGIPVQQSDNKKDKKKDKKDKKDKKKDKKDKKKGRSMENEEPPMDYSVNGHFGRPDSYNYRP